ncbi:MAG: type IV pilus modification protein PilV [Spongiibacteraceae bacterium]|jgi:type IV pilus assembly protein PilV|nr:type IV pilus modification protein PilV [Spongiibacteraceae bacterium]
MPLTANRRQTGATLIEVLVAVLVTVIGVLGAASLQMNSVKFNHIANTRSHATMLAYDVIDRMRANRAAALNGSYDIALADNAPNGNSIPETDLREWLNELAGRLPAGDGAVVRNGSSITVTVQWDESRLNETREAGSGSLESFSFETEL